MIDLAPENPSSFAPHVSAYDDANKYPTTNPHSNAKNTAASPHNPHVFKRLSSSFIPLMIGS
jgi:hypothetical protein